MHIVLQGLNKFYLMVIANLISCVRLKLFLKKGKRPSKVNGFYLLVFVFDFAFDFALAFAIQRETLHWY